MSRCARKPVLSQCAITLICLAASYVMAGCISLSDSLLCPAFSQSYINQNLTVYPFLANVDDSTSFDIELLNYMYRTWPVIKYTQQFQCPKFTPGHSYYARYLVTVLCASVVQQSLAKCGMGQSAQTICASSCAAYVESEAAILTSADCGLKQSSTTMNILRANFEACATPSSAFNSSECLQGFENDSTRCGFGHNIDQLCAYCTQVLDTCCKALEPSTCTNVAPKQTDIRPLPSITGIPVARPPPVSTSQPTITSTLEPLTAGKLVGIIIAGIVVFFALAALVIFTVRRYQRQRSVDNRMVELQSRPRSDAITTLSDVLARGSGTSRRTWSTHHSPLQEHDLPALPPAIWRSRSLIPSEASSSDDGEAHSDTDVVVPMQPTITYSSLDGTPTPDSALSFPRTRLRSNSSLTYATEPACLIDEHSGRTLRPGCLVTCVHGHDPDRDDELSLHLGDTLELTNLYDDRWAKGICHPRSEDDDVPRSGAFPIICITLCAPDSTSRGSHASTKSTNPTNPTDAPTSGNGSHGDPTPGSRDSNDSHGSAGKARSPHASSATSLGSRFMEHIEGSQN